MKCHHCKGSLSPETIVGRENYAIFVSRDVRYVFHTRCFFPWYRNHLGAHDVQISEVSDDVRALP